MTSSIFDVNSLAAFNGMAYKPAGAIFAVDGTAYPGAPGVPPPGAGFSSDLVYGLMDAQDGLWQSFFIGYPAATFPMGPSVQAGRANLVVALQNYAGAYYALNGSYDGMAIILTGYSQGAMVTGQVWVYDILADDGVLNYLLSYIYRIYLFGDPYRSPGIAHGNDMMGQALPPNVDGVVTGGIGGPSDLTAEQSNVLAPDGNFVVCSFANPGDLYADAPTGPSPWTAMAGPERVEYSVFKVVQQATFIDVISLALDLFVPIATIEAIINAMSFFAQGTNAPHWHYEAAMQTAINDALALGNSLPHANPV